MKKKIMILLLAVSLTGCGQDASREVAVNDQSPILEKRELPSAETEPEEIEEETETETPGLTAPALTLPESTEPEEPVDQDALKVADHTQQMLSYLTREEKAAQLLLTTPELLFEVPSFTAVASGDALKYDLLPVGGLVYARSNFTEKKQAKRLLSQTLGTSLKADGIPVFQTADADGNGAVLDFMDGEDDPLTFWSELSYYSSSDSFPLKIEEVSTPEEAVAALKKEDTAVFVKDQLSECHAAVVKALEEETIDPLQLDQSVAKVLEQKFSWMLPEMGLPEATDDENRLYYVDARSCWHFMLISPHVRKNPYEDTLFAMENEKPAGKSEAYTLKRGIDVSSHNGTIDWEKVKASDVDFAILRIAYRGYGEEGRLVPDTAFEENYKGAKAAGLSVGAYVFSQAVNETEAREEAALAISLLDGKSLDLPLVYDPESILDKDARTDNVTKEQFTQNTIAFSEAVKAAGFTPQIYANMIWESEYLELTDLEDLPIWYADYEPIPQTPYYFNLWQYSESGTVNGIEGPVDLDLMIVD